MAFLLGKVPSEKTANALRILAALLVLVGAGLSMEAAWSIAAILMGLMCLVNIPSCAILGKTAYAALGDYVLQKKAGKNPVLYAADIGLDTEKLDFWK